MVIFSFIPITLLSTVYSLLSFCVLNRRGMWWRIGNDKFIIGQLYNAPKGEFNVETTLTTRGYISKGCSSPLILRGGDGDDGFIAQHNDGILQVFGENGNMPLHSYHLILRRSLL